MKYLITFITILLTVCAYVYAAPETGTYKYAYLKIVLIVFFLIVIII